MCPCSLNQPFVVFPVFLSLSLLLSFPSSARPNNRLHFVLIQIAHKNLPLFFKFRLSFSASHFTKTHRLSYTFLCDYVTLRPKPHRPHHDHRTVSYAAMSLLTALTMTATPTRRNRVRHIGRQLAKPIVLLLAVLVTLLATTIQHRKYRPQRHCATLHNGSSSSNSGISATVTSNGRRQLPDPVPTLMTAVLQVSELTAQQLPTATATSKTTHRRRRRRRRRLHQHRRPSR